MKRIPTESQINVFDSLDERWAVKNFSGKSLDEAEALFRENFLHYQEALMWMGPVAFAFYAKAAMQYLLSAQSTGDSDAASSFGVLIQFRLDHEPESLTPIRIELCEFIRNLLPEICRFGCDPTIYGDVAGKYKLILEKLADQ